MTWSTFSHFWRESFFFTPASQYFSFSQLHRLCLNHWTERFQTVLKQVCNLTWCLRLVSQLHTLETQIYLLKGAFGTTKIIEGMTILIILLSIFFQIFFYNKPVHTAMSVYLISLPKFSMGSSNLILWPHPRNYSVFSIFYSECHGGRKIHYNFIINTVFVSRIAVRMCLFTVQICSLLIKIISNHSRADI